MNKVRITKNPLEYNTQRELHGIRVSRLDLDPADFGNRLFLQRITTILLYSRVIYANGAKFVIFAWFLR